MTKAGLPFEFLQEAIAYRGRHCLLWPYALNSAGYGHLMHEGKNVLAHRMVCEAINGPSPHDKQEAAHLCGNGHKGCVNPLHLEWKSRKDNASDMIAHGRAQRGEKHYMARLTEEKVRFIRANSDKYTAQQFAEMFGVSRAVIRHAQKRNSWAWVA